MGRSAEDEGSDAELSGGVNAVTNADTALFGSPPRPEKNPCNTAQGKKQGDSHTLGGLAQKKLDADLGSTLHSETSESHIDLMFDPILKCYFDPATNKYYELA